MAYESLEAIAGSIGYNFQNLRLLGRALRHPFAIYPKPKKKLPAPKTKLPDYHSLLRVGEKLLENAVKKYLNSEPKISNDFQRERAKEILLSDHVLAETAILLGLHEYHFYGASIYEDSPGKHKVLAEIFKSMLGGIYADSTEGSSSCEAIIRKYLFTDLNMQRIERLLRVRDYKFVLRKYAQRYYFTSPEYNIVSQKIGVHPSFEVEARIAETVIGSGKGPTRAEAEQKAALHALFRVLRLKEAPEKISIARQIATEELLFRGEGG